jgi:hypothetical protein
MDEDFSSLLAALRSVAELVPRFARIEGELGWAKEGLFLKFFLHCTSIYHLSRKTTIPAISIHYLDPASINSLIRNAIESYLTLHYNFIASPSINEQQFKYLQWYFIDVSRRVHFPVVTEYGKKKLEEVKLEIKDVQKRIRNSPHLQEFTEKQQMVLCDIGQWPLWDKDGKIPSLKKIAQTAGIHPSNFNDLHIFLCGYVHASYWSVRQLMSTNSEEDEIRIVEGSISALMIFMAYMIKTCFVLWPDIARRVQFDQATEKAIDIYHGIGSMGPEHIQL